MATTTTPHHRLTRKELREPDEFVSLVDAAGDYVIDHLPRVIAGAIGLLMLVLLGVGLHLYSNQQEQAAAEAFSSAGNVYDRKDYKTAAGQFAALAAQYPGPVLAVWRCSISATPTWPRISLPRRATPCKSSSNADDRPTFRQLALLQLGVAYEGLGNPAEARKAYEQAAAIREGAQGRAELELARLTLRQGDKPGAIAIYQRFLREHPFDQERSVVTDALSQLGVAPAAPFATAKTIDLPAN